jgi:diketogulonate reductase-like aldo/keto reductase
MSRGTCVIPKATSAEHQQENFDACGIELSKEEIAEISKLNKNEALFTSSPDVKFNMLS